MLRLEDDQRIVEEQVLTTNNGEVRKDRLERLESFQTEDQQVICDLTQPRKDALTVRMFVTVDEADLEAALNDRTVF